MSHPLYPKAKSESSRVPLDSIRGPAVPVPVPEDVLELVKTLEFGKKPLPRLYVYDFRLVIYNVGGVSGEENKRNFWAMRLAHFSTVPVHTVTLSYGEIDQVYADFPKRPGFVGLDDNQLEDEERRKKAAEVANEQAAAQRAARRQP